MPNVKKKSKKKDGEKLMSVFCPNFKIKEFACNDGTDRILIDKNIVYILQYARNYFKKALPINSAYRTVTYNRAIGGASNSYHLYGRADDLDGIISLNKMADLFNTLGVKGIIVYRDSNFVHIDTREDKYHADSDGVILKLGKVKIPFERYLNRSSKGLDVAIVQYKLMSLGYFKGKVCGYYNLETKQAVKKFQSDKGLEVTGHVNSNTWNKLFK